MTDGILERKSRIFCLMNLELRQSLANERKIDMTVLDVVR